MVMILTFKIACPECKAKEDAPCVINGKPNRLYLHKTRRREQEMRKW